MTTATLRIRYGPRSLRKPEAWYIAGSKPGGWLDEVAAWGVPHDALRLLPVPRSRTERLPCGVLVTGPDGLSPNVSPRCSAFGRAAGRLFLPVHAWFDPSISDDELGALLSDGLTYVWHPASGLIAFEPGDILKVSDLLATTSASSRRWDRARPGVALSQRLVSLLPETTLTIERIFKEGQGDIGAEGNWPSELPRSPREPRPGILRTPSRHGKRLLASIARSLSGLVPASADKPTWIDRVVKWSDAQLANFSAGLAASRNKQIARLLHLLQTDPDRGLRHAIPLGSGGHRGQAPPSDQLDERNVDFDLDRLGGGRPADRWDVPYEYQFELISRYRELANREMHLGRHRRAAFIFAELLGDFEAAAGALVAGRYWREAALLYQKRLDRPMDAARCLEEGGLWIEAIALYERLGNHETAGDLYGKLGQIDKAHEQYRKAVDNHRSCGDLISSARLLETKLASVDEAIHELASGWPHSAQAGQCLHGVFRILARLGRHEATRDWIKGFCQPQSPHFKIVELVDVLAETATTYPDRAVRAVAADGTRTLVSRHLPGTGNFHRQKLVSAVSRLAPEDRLLGRDCRRYAQQLTAVPKNRLPKRRPTTKAPVLVRTIELPRTDVVWKQAQACGRAIFVAGQKYGDLELIRCSWKQTAGPGHRWEMEPRLWDAPIVLAADPLDDSFVLVHVVGGPVLRTQRFTATDQCRVATNAGAIRGMSPGVVAAASTLHGVTWLLEVRSGCPTLVALGPDGEQISTRMVPVPNPSQEFDDVPTIVPIPFHVRGDKKYIGVHDQLLVFQGTRPPTTVECAQQITSLTGSAPNSRPRIAVTFARGGAVLWDHYAGGPMQSFGDDMPNPVVGFTRSGLLIAASEGRCEVYSTQDQRLKLETDVSLPHPDPIAVLSGPRTDQFGIVSKTGQVAVFQLP